MGPGEKWRKCPSDGNYDVSSSGRVSRAGRVLRPSVSQFGYETVQLSREGTARRRFVHRLIAEGFIGPRPDGLQVNHINGDKRDNRPENLEYVTPSENIRHSFRLGLSLARHGEVRGMAKLTDAEALAMRLRAADGSTYTALAARYRVSVGNVSMICRGIGWNHVGGPLQARRWLKP